LDETGRNYFTIQNTSSFAAMGTTGPDLLTISPSGNVGIGVIPAQFSQYKLEVAGAVRACRVRVEINNWCDYVFEEGYTRPVLREYPLKSIL